MADFIRQKCNGYTIVVQPSDSGRKWLARHKLDGLIPYFDASDIFFDMKVIMPKQAKGKIVEDSINYEWTLCDKWCEPIPPPQGRFQFFKVAGDGVFNISTSKSKAEVLESAGVTRESSCREITFRKVSAIKIGYVPNSDRYNIVMRFKCNNTSNVSEYQLAMVFNLFDKEKLRLGLFISFWGVLTLPHFIGQL